MAATEGGVDGNTKTVSELFDEGLVIFNGLSKNYEPTNSLPVQFLIKKCMHLLEDATNLVSLAGMFSTNETIEEVCTSEVKFILLPAILGTLTLKLCISNRLEVIDTAEVYFNDFLERCRNYGIIDFDIPKFKMPDSIPIIDDQGAISTISASAQSYNMAEMACTRNRKIQRFNEQKEIESKLGQLQEIMKDCDADDETKRTYYLTLIKHFTSQALDELDCLYSEKGFLLTRPKEEEPETSRKVRQRRPRKPLTPVVISTKNKGNGDEAC